MKKILFLILMISAVPVFAQSVSDATIQKRENRRGMILKEWNTAVGAKMPFLDHVTTYDSLGRKIEEIEYAVYGQKSRVVSEYPPNSDVPAKLSTTTATKWSASVNSSTTPTAPSVGNSTTTPMASWSRSKCMNTSPSEP